MTDTISRAPLFTAPTHIVGLLEFSRTQCGHWHLIGCADCAEFVSRGQLTDALRHVQTRPTARLGQTVVDAEELRYLLRRLDEFDQSARGFGETTRDKVRRDWGHP